MAFDFNMLFSPHTDMFYKNSTWFRNYKSTIISLHDCISGL